MDVRGVGIADGFVVVVDVLPGVLVVVGLPVVVLELCVVWP
jgi:hypothetical protein